MNATGILTTILTIYRKRGKSFRKESSVQLISSNMPISAAYANIKVPLRSICSKTATVFDGRLDCRFMEKERIMEIKHHVFHKT